MKAMPNDWGEYILAFESSPMGQSLSTRLENARIAGQAIFPPNPLRALELTSLAETKVVILGQDPYHGAGQAEGLAFSVPEGVKMPPSLRNIYKELERDLRIKRTHTSLVDWAQQGVLLLNTVLTVEEGKPASHAGWGWEMLTDALICAVAQKSEPVVFMLWGAHAQRKRELILAANYLVNQKVTKIAGEAEKLGEVHSHLGRHLILQANHPSPLSALRPPQPFIGCGHFGLANRFLEKMQIKPIIW